MTIEKWNITIYFTPKAVHSRLNFICHYYSIDDDGFVYFYLPDGEVTMVARHIIASIHKTKHIEENNNEIQS